MLPRNDLYHIQITFDDHRLLANAGLILAVTLAHHLGLGKLVDRHIEPTGPPGRAKAEDNRNTPTPDTCGEVPQRLLRLP